MKLDDDWGYPYHSGNLRIYPVIFPLNPSTDSVQQKVQSKKVPKSIAGRREQAPVQRHLAVHSRLVIMIVMIVNWKIMAILGGSSHES